MNNDLDHKRMVAAHLLFRFPASVRQEILSSESFKKQTGISTNSNITLGPDLIKFDSTIFYDGVRRLYAGDESEVSLTTEDGQKVRLAFQEADGMKTIRIEGESQTLFVHPFWFLSNTKQQRLQGFEEDNDDSNFSSDFKNRWRDRLEIGPLSEQEIDEYQRELRLYPEAVASQISEEIKKAEPEVSVLVPRSLEYYEHLIGPLCASETIDALIEGPAAEHLNELVSWKLHEGLGQALSCCSHPSMASLINLSDVSESELEDFFMWLQRGGDLPSIVAGFEVGVRAIDKFPSLEPHLLNIAKNLIDEGGAFRSGRLKLSTNLFILVDGELSRVALFKGKPPFWRRMAVFAHAAVLERELLAIGVDPEQADDWITNGRGFHFYLQSLFDMRREARWPPDLMNADQLRIEFISRLSLAAEAAKDVIPEGDLRSILMGDGNGSLQEHRKTLLAYLPGPLEGGTTSKQSLPEEFLTELRKPLTDDVLKAEVFAGVINTALVYRLDEEVPKLISKILQAVEYRINSGDLTKVSFQLLSGLALIAAVTRSPQLADEVRKLSRVLRRRGDLENNAGNQVRIALVAVASHGESDQWCSAVGDWLEELAHEDLDRDAAIHFRGQVRKLCQLEPTLWRHVAKIDAALASVIDR